MPFAHKLSRAILSVAILAALTVAGFLAYRHGAVVAHLTQMFVTAVKRIWS